MGLYGKTCKSNTSSLSSTAEQPRVSVPLSSPLRTFLSSTLAPQSIIPTTSMFMNKKEEHVRMRTNANIGASDEKRATEEGMKRKIARLNSSARLQSSAIWCPLHMEMVDAVEASLRSFYCDDVETLPLRVVLCDNQDLSTSEN